MPAYYSVSFQYDRAAISGDYLSALYSAMLQPDFTYGGSLAWGCPGDLTLEEVVRWNQERLDRNFNLGYTEHVSNDYRQVLLRHPRYDECRVIIHNWSCCVSVIVPEDDLFKLDGRGFVAGTRHEQVEPLKQLAINVWEQGLMVSVQTHGETGATASAESMTEGGLPAMLPFAIVRDSLTRRMRLQERGVRLSQIGGSGALLELARNRAAKNR